MTHDVEIEVVIDDSRWTDALADAEALAQRAITAAYTHVGYDGLASLCVLLTDDARVQELNRTYRGMDSPTNVLSFPTEETASMPGEPQLLGDVALAFDTLKRETDDTTRSFRNHFQHLIVHGSLHLIGYTHEAEGEAERMEALEIAILARLDVPNPYVDAG